MVMRNIIWFYSPESEGVMAKSYWGSNAPAAMGMATTLYATAHNKFWYTFAIVAFARSSASTTYKEAISVGILTWKISSWEKNYALLNGVA